MKNKKEQIKNLRSKITKLTPQFEKMKNQLDTLNWELICLLNPVDPNEPEPMVCRQDYKKKLK
jgi:hypothetical protein